MPKSVGGACRSHAHFLCLCAFGCFVAFSLLSSGSRAVRALADAGMRSRLEHWPVAPYAQTYRWVAHRVRGHDKVGWIELPGTPGGFHHEKIAADLRHIVKPTWLSTGREPVSLVTFDGDRDRDEVREEIEALGFPKIWLHPISRVAVALEDPKGRPSEFLTPRITRSDHFWGGLKLFSLAILPAFLVFRRRRRSRLPKPSPSPSHSHRSLPRLLAPMTITGVSLRSGLLAVLGIPYALAAACALGDAVGGSTMAVAVIYSGLIGAWSTLCTQVYLPLPDDPDSLAFRPPSLETLDGAALFRWSAFGLLVLGVGGLALRLGLRTEGMIDAVAMYNARARAIVLDPAFLGPFAPPVGAHSMHADYPPALTFAVAGAYTVSGSFSAVAPIFIQLCFWIGGLGLLLTWTHRRAGRAAALAVIALLAVLPHWHDRITDQCCDVPLGMTWMAAMTVWYRRRTVPVAAATGLLIGGTVLMKNEGLLLVSAWLFAMLATAPKSILGQPRRAATLLIGLGLAATLLVAFNASVPPGDLFGRLSVDNISARRTFIIGERFWQTIAWPGTYGWTFALVGTASAALIIKRFAGRIRGEQPERSPESLRALPLAIAVSAAGYFAVYAATSFDIEWHLRTSCDRLFAQIYPATLMLGVAIAGFVAPLSNAAEEKGESTVTLTPAPNRRWALAQHQERRPARPLVSKAGEIES